MKKKTVLSSEIQPPLSTTSFLHSIKHSARVLANIQNNIEENKTVMSSEKQTTPIRRRGRRRYTEDEKIYICAKCAKSYPTRGNLNRHIRLKCH